MKDCTLPASEAGEAIDNSSCLVQKDGGGLSAMSPEEMEVVVAKIISLLVLTILSVLAGLLPLRLLRHFPSLFSKHRSTVDYFLCGLRCLSGGVFLATGFLHLLPDTREKMSAVLMNLGSQTTYAVTELLIVAGFFLVVFVEQIIKFLYIKAERSDQLRAANGEVTTGAGVALDTNGGAGGAGGGLGGVGVGMGGGGCASNGAGRYSLTNDKGVIPSTLEEMEEEILEGQGTATAVDMVGSYSSAYNTNTGSYSASAAGTLTSGVHVANSPNNPVSSSNTSNTNGGCSSNNNTSNSHGSYNCETTTAEISAIGGGGGGCNTGTACGFAPNGSKDYPGCGGYSDSGFGVCAGCNSSLEDQDSDSVNSDTLMKEEHAAFADPLAEFDYPTHDLDYDLDPEPMTLKYSRHSVTLRRSHSLPELGVTKVVKQLSQADLTRRAHFRSIIYIMALSLHGIFEGLALGLQSTESSVWSLCFALCLHRCVLAFQLGMDLCGARESQGTAFLCIGTFTLISAVGIVAGILFSSGAMLYADVTVPEAILQSLATGTIIYIVFFDILFKDLQGAGDLKRVSCCFVGFALMAIILAIITR